MRPEACAAAEADVSATGTVFANTSAAYSSDPVHVSAIWQSWKLAVTASPDWVVHGNPASVKAKLTVGEGGTPVAGQSVVLTADYGTFNPHNTGYPQRYTANTNSSGEINTTLTVSECPVTAAITGITTTCSGGCTFSGSDTLLVICNESDAKKLVIVLDWTDSMRQFSPLVNQAAPGLARLMNDLKASGQAIAVGGVKFANTVNDAYTLPLTSDHDAAIRWVNDTTGAPLGLDTNENALEALKKASELVPGCYIALATDAGFHYWGDNNDGNSSDHSYNQPPDSNDCIYTELTVQQVRTILLNAQCRVYIDPGDGWNDYTARGDYANAVLYVNGAMEDDPLDPNPQNRPRYSFPKLEAAMGQ